MPEVRNTFNRSWTRLFQADDHYIDLSLRPRDQAAVLRGQVLVPTDEDAIPQGAVHLYDQDRSRIASVVLGASGTFSLELHTATHFQLLFELESKDIWVRDLEVD